MNLSRLGVSLWLSLCILLVQMLCTTACTEAEPQQKEVAPTSQKAPTVNPRFLKSSKKAMLSKSWEVSRMSIDGHSVAPHLIEGLAYHLNRDYTYHIRKKLYPSRRDTIIKGDWKLSFDKQMILFRDSMSMSETYDYSLNIHTLAGNSLILTNYETSDTYGFEEGMRTIYLVPKK